MDRRNFIGGLAGILASGFAPASVASGVLMPVRRLFVPARIRHSIAVDLGGPTDWGEWRDITVPMGEYMLHYQSANGAHNFVPMNLEEDQRVRLPESFLSCSLQKLR